MGAKEIIKPDLNYFNTLISWSRCGGREEHLKEGEVQNIQYFCSK
jgi:hypothetical protein